MDAARCHRGKGKCFPDPISEVWPELPQSAWSDTCATLQLWMQMVGKVRLALMPTDQSLLECHPLSDHSRRDHSAHAAWHAMLQIDFDFLEHLCWSRPATGAHSTIPLEPMTVAAFYQS